MQLSPATTSPRLKRAPTLSPTLAKFSYAPSDDGTDENLLILLHGLGDTHIPFSKLARSLKLPQTAVLALRAPQPVPFLYEDAWQWFPSFDSFGEPLDHPNPTPALELLDQVFKHLIDGCQWPIGRIHLFGFAQGGTVATEYALSRWKSTTHDAPASVVTISGPLLSYPTLPSPCPTPVLLAHRPPPAESALPAGSLGAMKKGFASVTESVMSAKREGMPVGRDEWEPIMRFWSERLSRRPAEGLYEVMSGMAPVA